MLILMSENDKLITDVDNIILPIILLIMSARFSNGFTGGVYKGYFSENQRPSIKYSIAHAILQSIIELQQVQDRQSKLGNVTSKLCVYLQNRGMYESRQRRGMVFDSNGRHEITDNVQWR